MSELTLFDGYEIAPVRRDYHDNSCEVCAPSEAHFWTLYGHMPDGEVQAISDLKTQADCEALLYRITGHRDYFFNAMAEGEGSTIQGGNDAMPPAPQLAFTALIAVEPCLLRALERLAYDCSHLDNCMVIDKIEAITLPEAHAAITRAHNRLKVQ